MLGRLRGPLQSILARDHSLPWMITLFLTIMTVVVFAILLPESARRQAFSVPSFLLLALVISLNLERPERSITPGGYLVSMLVYLAFTGVAFLTMLTGYGLLLLVTPWLVVLLSFIFSREGQLSFWWRLLPGIGCVLFLGLLALADLRGLWWQSLLLALACCLLVLIGVNWHYRSNWLQGVFISCLLIVLAGLLTCGLGAIGLAQSSRLERGMMTAFVGILCTSQASLVHTLKGRLFVWSCVLLLLLGVSYLWVAHTPLTTGLALASGALLVEALLGSWRLEISRLLSPTPIDTDTDDVLLDRPFEEESDESDDC
ncbi:hypothetical protein [Thermogemmatispora carboxidivorans]|uniref:hypothetical protein n=1 Tax=Thermogemmatispora carboxidivorans TaxID=1382306 RepID=UPI0012DE9AEF|nr:hypothetical protein [Thermogemmatispora carboxidivorans]